MKLRCPYCSGTFGPDPSPRCPHCAKTIVLPAALRKTTFHERKQARERIVALAEQKRRQLGLKDFRFPRKSMILVAGVVLFGIAALFGLPRSTPRPGPSPLLRADKELTVLRIALERFRRDCGRYPSTDEGLLALINNPGAAHWRGPYVNLIKPDPWRTPYVYRLEGTNVVLFSGGADKTAGTAGDVPAPDVSEIADRVD